MTFANFFHRKWRAGEPFPERVRFRHWGSAVVLLVALILAYSATLAYLFHQATLLTEPGDRLVVVFAPDTPVPAALERLGSAGVVLAGTTGMPWFYLAEAIDQAAAARLADSAWVMRVPGEPTFAGCVAFVLDKRAASGGP